jgi:hypothetical protein
MQMGITVIASMPAITWNDLSVQQCFPTMVWQIIIRGSTKDHGINIQQFFNAAKITKCPQKYCGKFCLAIGNTGAISVCKQLPFCFHDCICL